MQSPMSTTACVSVCVRVHARAHAGVPTAGSSLLVGLHNGSQRAPRICGYREAPVTPSASVDVSPPHGETRGTAACLARVSNPFSLFSKVVPLRVSPPAREGSDGHTSPSTHIFHVPGDGQPSGYQEASTDLHSPMTSDAKHLFMCLLTCLYFFFGGVSRQILCPLLKWTVFLLCCSES